MDNKDIYHFEDFTLMEYANLLDIAKQKYTFKEYKNFNLDEGNIIWRHDIDMSPTLALKLAKIESNKNLKATYFILLHSEFYNLLDAENVRIIKSIINLGHDIGLHFDAYFYNIMDQNKLDELILFEKNILEKIFDIKITSFSFHNNTTFTLSCENETYGGLINVYSKTIKKIPYCSDSNGYWRYRRLKDVLTEAKDFNLQVLTHEVWWQEEIMSPKQKILKCIQMQSKAIGNNYDSTISRLGLLNIDW